MIKSGWIKIILDSWPFKNNYMKSTIIELEVSLCMVILMVDCDYTSIMYLKVYRDDISNPKC